MRLDKTFARILLIFFIANLVLAAPALVRQTRFVTDRLDNEPTDESTPLLEPASESSTGSGWASQAPTPSPTGSLDQDSTPVSVASQPNVPQRASGTLELHDVPLPTSEATQLHNDPLAGTATQPIFEGSHPSWQDFRPGTEIEEVVEPDVNDVPDLHTYDDDDDYLGFDEPGFEIYNDKMKPKGLCGLSVHCWDWDFSEVFSDWDWYKWKLPRSFERRPENPVYI